jgi:hypothetical protein
MQLHEEVASEFDPHKSENNWRDGMQIVVRILLRPTKTVSEENENGCL